MLDLGRLQKFQLQQNHQVSIRRFFTHSFTLYNTAADTSGPPRNMSISAIMHHQLSISWEAPPLSDLNGEIQGYSVVLRGITTNSFRNVTIENVLQLTVTELHPDHRYQIQIAVITDTGIGVYSEAISATTWPYCKDVSFMYSLIL